MLEALHMAQVLLKEFTAFNRHLKAVHPEHLVAWEKEVEDYENDKTKPCPYLVAGDCEWLCFVLNPACSHTGMLAMTISQAKLKLVQLEEEERRSNSASPAKAKAGPTAFIVLGMEIEDAQYVLCSCNPFVY